MRCTPAEAAARLGRKVRLPALRDGEQLADEPEAIARFLEDTARTLARWGQFQTDACYLDDEGKVC